MTLPTHRERVIDARRELEDLADEATSPTVYGLLMEAVALTTSALKVRQHDEAPDAAQAD